MFMRATEKFNSFSASIYANCKPEEKFFAFNYPLSLGNYVKIHLLKKV